ncbi:FGFR1 oncogene partner-like isoform X5 [Anneissia japonica]|uniref:FGFR1 oncogene partner-like isoform X4 n=1 Tax=Anneissia japonica TaxID=1529436 RepID=UPI001425A451|nr:FGFR1 oncogene partner-like isoform X4 [Anneissia japonica]XP_033120503.1 FGFR1 oncogene partner-like isoform X5 [Anneissia japonica]
MSADEDTELRDLVAQTLENNGVLGKIRAEIRASVFLALEEQDKVRNKTPFVNQELKKFLVSKEGQTAAALVYEFLDYFNLDFTVAVFNPETNFSDKYEGREKLAKTLDLSDNEKSRARPLICELLKKISKEPVSRSKDVTNEIILPKDLTSKQVSDAHKKFEYYDKDKNGTIDKDELRNLFIDIFPHFHRNMLERYVNDEFKSGDRDFSSGIDFDEFLGMYKRLFVLCKSVVSHDVSEILPGSPKSFSSPIKTASLDEQSKDSSNMKDDGAGKKLNGIKSRSLSGSSLESDDNDDSFFDTSPRHSKPTSIPQPKKSNSPPSTPPTSPTTKPNGLTSLGNAPPIGGSGMGSLTGAPPLSGLGGNRGASSPDWKDLHDINKEIGKLSYNTNKDDSQEDDYDDDDDYEDDFQSSQGSRSQSQSHGGPRSYKSSEANSIIEDLEVPEDVSDDIDFFNSSQEKFDDLTADRSASQLSQSGNFDYVEDVQFTS